ncbi:hypothetical protein ACHQM5_015403 [Ranunculus cassubicifolius]
MNTIKEMLPGSHTNTTGTGHAHGKPGVVDQIAAKLPGAHTTGTGHNTHGHGGNTGVVGKIKAALPGTHTGTHTGTGMHTTGVGHNTHGHNAGHKGVVQKITEKIPCVGSTATHTGTAHHY